MSIDEENLTPAQRELESALAGLSPAAAPFTLRQVEMRALVARERGRTRRWQAIAALLAVAAGAGFYSSAHSGSVASPLRVEQVVRHNGGPIQAPPPVDDPAPPRDRPEQGSYAYLKLREKVFSHGVESLRATRTPLAQPVIESTAQLRRPAPPQMPAIVQYLFSGGRL